MSQYGAFGMAKAGRTYDQILEHYYTGIELGAAPTDQVRVLLSEGRRSVVVSSTVKFTARDATGRVYRFPAGPITVDATLELPTPEGPATAVSPPARSAASGASRKTTSGSSATAPATPPPSSARARISGRSSSRRALPGKDPSP